MMLVEDVEDEGDGDDKDGTYADETVPNTDGAIMPPVTYDDHGTVMIFFRAGKLFICSTYSSA